MIFSDGFESGNFSGWSSYGGSSGVACQVVASAAMHGGYGCRISANGAGVGSANGWASRTFAGSYAEFFVRFHFRLTSVVNWRDVQIVLFGSYWAHPQMSCAQSGGRYRLWMRTFNDSGGWTNTAYGPLFDLGQTVCVEGYFKMATAPGANNGVLRFWQDGALVAELTNVDNDTMGNSSSAGIFCYNLAAPFQAQMDFDDFAVATERLYPLRGYRVYDNRGAGPVDYSAPRAVTSEYAPRWTSDALSGPAAWRFGVRAYNEFGEEKNLDVASDLVLLASGAAAPLRPNHPADLAAAASAGGRVEIAFSYNDTGEAAACTHFHVYADNASGAIDYATPIGAVAKDDVGPRSRYVFLTGALADGAPRRFAIRAATAADVEDDGTESAAVIPDASAPAQPASLTAGAVR